MKKNISWLQLLLIVIFLFSYRSVVQAQPLNPKYYEVGSPTLTNIWVDPINGRDENDGSSRSKALLTLSAAWNLIPRTISSTGYKINLVAGTYAYRDQATNNIVGLYLDERHGTFNYPIIIEAVDGNLSAHLYSPLDFRDIAYVYLIGLDFKTDPNSDGGGNTLHFADGNHILIKNCTINGFDGTTRKPQETLKVNQVQYIYVENCDISGAFWFSLDYVGVQYGHIQGSKIHDASVDCLLLKGGTAQIRVEGNTIYNAERFGFSAGQGAGFDFLVSPWLHYEAYDLKFFNNIIYNTAYAGIAVLGAYNTLIAYNTLYKVGILNTDGRSLLTFNLGQRGCDGVENERCNQYHQIGGWSPGPWSTPPLNYGEEVDCIPNKNTFVYNNIFYNPGGDSTLGGHFEIRAPYDASDQSPTFLTSSNLPNPVLSDDNLQIKGNIIWNGINQEWLGLDENTGGQDSNPTCNRAQLLRDNTINKIEPQFINHTQLNFHPAISSNIFSAATFTMPNFTGNDRPAQPQIPHGNLINDVPRDYDGNSRSSNTTPGAYVTSASTDVNYSEPIIPSQFELHQNYPNPFNPSTVINYKLSSANHITLKIYDVLGREIMTLVNEFKQAGTYSSILNTQHSALTSGFYFYTLSVGNRALTKKMILIK